MFLVVVMKARAITKTRDEVQARGRTRGGEAREQEPGSERGGWRVLTTLEVLQRFCNTKNV
jgi:hypothetical protein